MACILGGEHRRCVEGYEQDQVGQQESAKGYQEEGWSIGPGQMWQDILELPSCRVQNTGEENF